MTKRTSLFPPEHRIEHDKYKADLADDAFKEAMMEAGYLPQETTAHGTDNPRPMAPMPTAFGSSSMDF